MTLKISQGYIPNNTSGQLKENSIRPEWQRSQVSSLTGLHFVAGYFFGGGGGSHSKACDANNVITGEFRLLGENTACSKS